LPAVRKIGMWRLAACCAFVVWPGIAAEGEPSPAEKAITEAEAAVAKNPGRYEAHNALARAFARRARETSDPKYYDKASAALKKSLALEPDNLEARKLEGWLLLGKHEFAEALKVGRELNRRIADDWMVYGLITDACIELGKYKEAEEAAQWMLDMGRSNVPSLTRAAYLRELFGDIEGAIELMTQAYGRIEPSLVEDRAWVLVQIGHLRTLTGDHEQAEAALNEALRLFPGYHYALGNLAKVRMAQGKAADAATLFEQRYRAAPHPENLFDVGVAQDKAKRTEQARKTFAEFEAAARKEMDSPDNSNRELIFYYADYGGKASEAVAIGLKEIVRRRDVHTVDAYAWALYKAGQAEEARREIEAALEVGVRDPKIFYHAGAIAAKQKDYAAARRYLEKSLEMNPRSEVQATAKEALEKLGPVAVAKQ